MKTVWKYPLQFDRSGNEVRQVPKGARILHLEMQHEIPTIWFEVDDKAEKEDRTFKAIDTGGKVPKKGVYVGSLIMAESYTDIPGANWVSHIYEIL